MNKKLILYTIIYFIQMLPAIFLWNFSDMAGGACKPLVSGILVINILILSIILYFNRLLPLRHQVFDAFLIFYILFNYAEFALDERFEKCFWLNLLLIFQSVLIILLALVETFKRKSKSKL